MSDAELIWGVGALSVALVGATVSAVLAISDARSGLAQRRAERAEAQAYEAAQEHEEAVDAVVVDLMILEMEIAAEERRPNYRHNLHCPDCGRFARRVLPDSSEVVDCRVHGVRVRWKDVPVDWASTPVLVDGVTVLQHDLTLGQPVELIEILRPDTAPIDIIIPDDLSELEEMGAVV